MKMGRLEIVYHKSEPKEINWRSDFKTECGIWYYLPIKWSVIHYLNQGKKLHAVKLYKYRKGEGLKESKQWVDKLQEKKKITIKYFD